MNLSRSTRVIAAIWIWTIGSTVFRLMHPSAHELAPQFPSDPTSTVVLVLLPLVFFGSTAFVARQSPFYVPSLARWVNSRFGAHAYESFLVRLRPLLLFAIPAILESAIGLQRSAKAGTPFGSEVFFLSCGVSFAFAHVVLYLRKAVGVYPTWTMEGADPIASGNGGQVTATNEEIASPQSQDDGPTRRHFIQLVMATVVFVSAIAARLLLFWPLFVQYFGYLLWIHIAVIGLGIYGTVVRSRRGKEPRVAVPFGRVLPLWLAALAIPVAIAVASFIGSMSSVTFSGRTTDGKPISSVSWGQEGDRYYKFQNDSVKVEISRDEYWRSQRDIWSAFASAWIVFSYLILITWRYNWLRAKSPLVRSRPA